MGDALVGIDSTAVGGWRRNMFTWLEVRARATLINSVGGVKSYMPSIFRVIVLCLIISALRTGLLILVTPPLMLSNLSSEGQANSKESLKDGSKM